MKSEWEELQLRLKERFGSEVDVDAILFMIGLQELSKPYQKYKKDEKLAPSHYFKTANKEEVIDYKKYNTSAMYTSKKHLISPMPKMTLIDIIQR